LEKFINEIFKDTHILANRKKDDLTLEEIELFLSEHIELLPRIKAIADRLGAPKEEVAEIPLHIFSSRLNPAEAVVKYLHENRRLRLCEISIYLGRKENTIWLNYQRANKEMPDTFVIPADEKLHIPLSAFGNPGLSFLESMILYLRDNLNQSNNQVAQALKKNPKVLSMAYNRAHEKINK
jgi:hypothetical protein